jgi:hypothetical protein
MTIRKRQDTGNLNKQHQIALCGELALEKATGFSWDTLRNGHFSSANHNFGML